MNINDEVYTLEQLRKMNALDGDKKLVFLNKVNEYIDDRERIHQINLECARVGAKEGILDVIKERGFWKEGDKTFMITVNDYPHDDRCEDAMCWCTSRAKREDLAKWEKYKRKEKQKEIRPSYACKKCGHLFCICE